MKATDRESPVTFSNLDRTEISRRYSAQDVPVLLSDHPSMTSYSENGNGVGYTYLNLRGFDQRRISVMVNGIPQNDPEDHNVYWIDFPDLLSSSSSIQVQRGAGSAFYGPPAIGGSINIEANPFASRNRITLESMIGFQELEGSSPLLNTRKHLASISSGIIDGRYLLYGKLSRLTSDGYRTGAWVEMNSYFLGALRIDGQMNTRFHLYGGPIADGLSYTGLPKFVNQDHALRRENLSDWGVAGDTSYLYTVPRKPQEVEQFSQPHYELINEWSLTPSLTLSNTMFYVTGDGYFDYSGDWVLGGYFDENNIWQWYSKPAAHWFSAYVGYDTTRLFPYDTTRSTPSFLIRGAVHNAQWGWLPRLTIEHTAGTLAIGGELRFHRSTHWGSLPFASEYPSPAFDPATHIYHYEGEKDILSAYAHEIFRVTENLTVLADLQLVYNRYGIQNEYFAGNSFSVPYTFLNPRAGVNLNINEMANAYISLAYTSREPRLRNLYAAEDAYFGATPEFQHDTSGGIFRYNFDQPLAQPEHLLDVELGGGWFTPSLSCKLNFYWMEFTDELVRSGNVDIFGQPVTGNAERTRHMGMEVDIRVNLINGLTVSGNGSISRNRLIRHKIFVPVTDSTGVSFQPLDLGGNPIAGFPDALANVRLTYENEVVTLSTGLKFVGDFHTDNFNSEETRNDAYTVVNTELLYRLPRLLESDITIRAEVRNLLNRLYFSHGEGNAFFPAAERNYLLGLTINM